MQKLCRIVLMCAALMGLMHLSATSVEGQGKGKNKKTDKTKQDNSHIYKALELIHEAHHNAKSAPKTFNRFGGHRNKSVEHMDHAIKELDQALKSVKAKPHKTGKLAANAMPMHHALKQAREAVAIAKNSPHDYSGHRVKAIEHMEHAIHELEKGVKYYEEHPPK